MQPLNPHKIFKFSDADLTQNLDGKITRAQKLHLMRRGLLYLGISAFFTSMVVMTLLYSNTEAGAVIFMLAAGVTAVIFGMMSRETLWSPNNDSVKSVTGTPTFERVSRNFFMMVGTEKFVVTARQRRVFTQGKSYTICYLSPSKTILSVAPN